MSYRLNDGFSDHLTKLFHIERIYTTQRDGNVAIVVEQKRSLRGTIVVCV
jgi:hypothetical protein